MLEGALHKQVDRSEPKKISFKNETTFTSEKYFTNLNGIFTVMEMYGFTLYEEQNAEHLMDVITPPDIELKI